MIKGVVCKQIYWEKNAVAYDIMHHVQSEDQSGINCCYSILKRLIFI